MHRWAPRVLVAGAVGLVAVPFASSSIASAQQQADAHAKRKPAKSSNNKDGEKPKKRSKRDVGKLEWGCRVQEPQDFLKRRTFVKNRLLDPTKHRRALRWLVERYGHVETEQTRAISSRAAASQAKAVRFMGLPISVHAKIAPALACVEKRIRAKCKKPRYRTTAIGGFRDHNSYRGVEVSNHLFGIAIDLDPEKNPCCGCVEPWSSDPLCTKPVTSVYERTALPKCWIESFERYGFDWLGHDELEDTMHFEFLGDPDRIRK